MIEKTFQAKKNHPRLDIWLAAKADLSRTEIKRLLAAGKIKGPQSKLKPAQEVKARDKFTLYLERTDKETKGEDIPLDIVYEDEDLLVVNKQKGLVVHPAAGHLKSTLVNALIYYLGDNLSDLAGEERRGIVHRLDKDSSGLMLVAKNNETHKALAAQLKERAIKRIYQAIAWGRFEARSLLIDAPIGRDPKRRQRMAVISDGKAAQTKVDIIEQARYGARIECELISGRTHQIRVHLAYIGHPLVDDLIYGGSRAKVLGRGQLLHAQALEFIQPKTAKRIKLISNLPPEFSIVMEHMQGDR